MSEQTDIPHPDLHLLCAIFETVQRIEKMLQPPKYRVQGDITKGGVLSLVPLEDVETTNLG